jgi:RNA 2',3'-cyclic 3'-phosphodiesterase
MQRLFFSLTLSTTQQQQLLCYQQQALTLCPDARATDLDNLHLTLFFLGQVTPGQKQRLCEAVSALTVPAFNLTLNFLGAFARPKIVYLAPAVIPPALMQLQQQVANICKAQGFADMYAQYQPHITLARHAICDANLRKPVAAVTLKITSFALYQSTQLDDRLQYVPLHHFELA